MNFLIALLMLMGASLACAQSTYWVATNGVDSPANGSEGSP